MASDLRSGIDEDDGSAQWEDWEGITGCAELDAGTSAEEVISVNGEDGQETLRS
jgi:hypothetical protein